MPTDVIVHLTLGEITVSFCDTCLHTTAWSVGIYTLMDVDEGPYRVGTLQGCAVCNPTADEPVQR